MKKIIVLIAIVFMCSVSNVSAQTLDQYKNTQPKAPTMDELVRSSDLRAIIPTSDLKVVYSYCQSRVDFLQKSYKDNQTLYNSTKIPMLLDGLQTTQQNINLYSKYCSDIQSELNARPAPTAELPASMTTVGNSKVATSTSMQKYVDSVAREQATTTNTEIKDTNETIFENQIHYLNLETRLFLALIILEIIGFIAITILIYRKFRR